ncbi:NAD(P)H-hydrate dehydratase [Conchiformibius steedae]|uniref:ADP-dependent (S)-NAD(P)H-hydrate dehydratase n=1 Tax=Conchiformibius steedae TaxID=153493 RepID=A0A3P2A162_9NEIS|nr:NAD(P)H-hydrate dehydratase [Conchiformibius steedae]RRD89152.1 NAD(P)H-hydrate dehydratase [Conchiformibius steedae]
MTPFDTETSRRYALQHFPDICQPRPENSHKGTFGTVAVIGGSKGMTGAALLAAEAALYGGCGKVMVGLEHYPPPVHHARLELMADDAVSVSAGSADVWVLGCGLAETDRAAALLAPVCRRADALVLDAGALNLLAKQALPLPDVGQTVRVLTPHPGEAARLLKSSVDAVEQNRVWAARELSSRHQAWVVLKGHESVIASAQGFLRINRSGNAGLATAGSGDVLAGLIGSLLAQGIAVEQAIAASVWLHGVAAEWLAARQTGPIGLLAGELPVAIRWLRNRLVSTAGNAA